MRMCSCCGNEISAAKRPRPVSSGRSSRRVSEWPTSFGFAVAGAIAQLGLPPRFALPQLAGGRAHRLHDVLIAGAAAKIGRQHVDQILVADIGLALQHAGDQHEKAGRAEAALQAVVLHEGALQRVELVAVRQAFDGADLFAVRPAPRTSGRSAPARRRPAPCRRRRRRARSRYACRSVRNPRGWHRPACAAARREWRGLRPLIVRVISLSLAHAVLFPACRSAARMRCGVAGISLIVTPNGAQRIVDGVENRRRRADRAAFAEALGSG